MPTVKAGKFTVTAEHLGTVDSPFARGECEQFKLTAKIGRDSYSTDGHGSVHDHEAGVELSEQGETLCWSLLDDIASAANDPDEFWTLATDGITFEKQKVESVLELLRFAENHNTAIGAIQGAVEAHR